MQTSVSKLYDAPGVGRCMLLTLLLRYSIRQPSDENEEKYQLRDYQLIQYLILQTNIIGVIWQTVRRTTNEILRVKELRHLLLET